MFVEVGLFFKAIVGSFYFRVILFLVQLQGGTCSRRENRLRKGAASALPMHDPSLSRGLLPHWPFPYLIWGWGEPARLGKQHPCEHGFNDGWEFTLTTLWTLGTTDGDFVFSSSGSMEPAFHRGDLLFLTNFREDPIRAGEIVVFKVEGRDIPIVHRVIKVHEK